MIKKLDTTSFIRLPLMESLSPKDLEYLEKIGSEIVDSVQFGDYELYLLTTPTKVDNNSHPGYILGLKRFGMSFLNKYDVYSPNANQHMSPRVLVDTIKKWNKEYNPIYVSSFNQDKLNKYRRILDLTGIQYTKMDVTSDDGQSGTVLKLHQPTKD